MKVQHRRPHTVKDVSILKSDILIDYIRTCGASIEATGELKNEEIDSIAIDFDSVLCYLALPEQDICDENVQDT